MEISEFPALNATLNGLAGVLLATGFVFIKRRNITAHKTCMISAFLVSALFLCCYLYYHYHAGSKRFEREGILRTVYLTILLTHTVLAVVTVPLALKTFYHAFRSEWDKHRRVAKWTFPVWMYVSITGVIVYLMLYQLFPAGG